MYRFRYFIVLLCVAAIGFGACNRIPDHAKYIPKDAAVVVGIDIKALTKKVAWNAITGSKLYQNMQKNLQGKTGSKSLEDAGIDMMNTMYVYMMGSNKGKGQRITGLIPLSDAGKLETFVKGNFPGKAINEQGKIKTVMLDNGMYLGWNDKLLMIMNANSLMDDDDYDDSTGTVTKQPNETELVAELQAAFNISAENSLVNNDRYAELEHEQHDVLFWMNYEQVMNKYMGQGMSGMMSGLTLTNSFWKDAALTAGFDFEKGRIAGTMHYYLSDDAHQIGRELGSTIADKEMINKLPAKSLDMLFACHLSTKGTHDLLEKMGVLGFANVALGTQNMDVDYVLDAFTGDMALALNDFKVKAEPLPTDDTIMSGPTSPYHATTRMVNFVYVLKINKKQNFDKLLTLGKDVIHPMSKDAYYFSYYFDSLYMVCNDQYAVISNKPENASAYLQNAGATIAGAETVYGHPMGFYMNFQQLMSSIDPGIGGGSLSDSAMLTQSKKLLQNLLISGADFKKNNFEYHMELNFVNKEENSLIQLMDFAMKISDEKEQQSPNL